MFEIPVVKKTPEEMEIVMKNMAVLLKDEAERRKWLGDDYDAYMAQYEQSLAEQEETSESA